jgi:hypothetical protein
MRQVVNITKITNKTSIGGGYTATQVKDTAYFITCHEGTEEGSRGIVLLSSSALDGDGWLMPRPGMIRYTFYMKSKSLELSSTIYAQIKFVKRQHFFVSKILLTKFTHYMFQPTDEPLPWAETCSE